MSTLSDTSNKYALACLRERRAEMAGEITQTEQHLRHLRESIAHLDATLRLFDPNADPSKIAAKRPYKRVKLFGAGKLNRMILDALRRAGGPVSTAEVTAAIVTEVGFGEDAAKGLKNRVRATLCTSPSIAAWLRRPASGRTPRGDWSEPGRRGLDGQGRGAGGGLVVFDLA